MSIMEFLCEEVKSKRLSAETASLLASQLQAATDGAEVERRFAIKLRSVSDGEGRVASDRVAPDRVASDRVALDKASTTRAWSTTFTGREFFFTDHRIQ